MTMVVGGISAERNGLNALGKSLLSGLIQHMARKERTASSAILW